MAISVYTNSATWRSGTGTSTTFSVRLQITEQIDVTARTNRVTLSLDVKGGGPVLEPKTNGGTYLELDGNRKNIANISKTVYSSWVTMTTHTITVPYDEAGHASVHVTGSFGMFNNQGVSPTPTISCSVNKTVNLTSIEAAASKVYVNGEAYNPFINGQKYYVYINGVKY